MEFPSYVNLHFHFTLMQKFKFWYQLEDNSIRNNFGPSVQRAFHTGGQGPPGGRDPTMQTETAVISELITLSQQIIALKTPHVKYALDTQTTFVPYTIIFKLVPKFKLLHQSVQK